MSADLFYQTLVDETRKLNSTDEVESLAEKAIKIIEEKTGLKVQDLKYFAREARGTVRVVWEVKNSAYCEDFYFIVGKSEKALPWWGNCTTCMHQKLATMASAFRATGLHVYHRESDGYHYMEVFIHSHDVLEAKLLLCTLIPTGPTPLK